MIIKIPSKSVGFKCPPKRTKINVYVLMKHFISRFIIGSEWTHNQNNQTIHFQTKISHTFIDFTTIETTAIAISKTQNETKIVFSICWGYGWSFWMIASQAVLHFDQSNTRCFMLTLSSRTVLKQKKKRKKKTNKQSRHMDCTYAWTCARATHSISRCATAPNTTSNNENTKH